MSSSLKLDYRLTALRAIYNGLIPGLLIHSVDKHANEIDKAIKQWIEKGKLIDKNAKRLLTNFVTGDMRDLCSSLLKYCLLWIQTMKTLSGSQDSWNLSSMRSHLMQVM